MRLRTGTALSSLSFIGWLYLRGAQGGHVMVCAGVGGWCRRAHTVCEGSEGQAGGVECGWQRRLFSVVRDLKTACRRV